MPELMANPARSEHEADQHALPSLIHFQEALIELIKVKNQTGQSERGRHFFCCPENRLREGLELAPETQVIAIEGNTTELVAEHLWLEREAGKMKPGGRSTSPRSGLGRP